MREAIIEEAATDYESPYPECRVLATANPVALLRLDLTPEQAAALATDVQSAVDDHQEDGLLDIDIRLKEETFAVLSQAFDNLAWALNQTIEGTISANVPARDAGNESNCISVAVLLSSEQVQDLAKTTTRDLERSEGATHVWRFSCTEYGARLLVEQLIAAIHGVDDPLDFALEEVNHDD